MSLKDDDIERLFQKGASRPEIEFHEEDWHKMEEMLDKEQAKIITQHHRRWMIGGMIGMGILLLTTASYFLLTVNKIVPQQQFATTTTDLDSIFIDNQTSSESSGVSDVTGAQNKETSAVSNLGSESLNNQDIFSLKQQPPTTYLGERRNEIKTATPAHERFEIFEQTNVTKNKIDISNASSMNNSEVKPSYLRGNDVKEASTKTNKAAFQREVYITTQESEKNELVAEYEQSFAKMSVGFLDSWMDREKLRSDSQKALATSEDKLNSRSRNSNLFESDFKGNDMSEVKVLSADTVAGNERTKDESEKAIGKEYEENSSPTFRWSISATVAPDFSSTGLSDYTTPGTTYGVMVHYKVLNKVTVSTGALKSDKQYWGNGYEYTPPTGYWQARTNGILPDRIDGNCMVLEIPLSLRYDLMEVKKSMLYVAAGVSSYHMLDEYYRYTFDEPNPGASSGWKAREKESFWFSIGTVSFGYERLLNQRLSLGVEPYLKVPFSGVGWPSLKLYSSGAYLTLRYRMLKKGVPSSPP